jgi:hypothetical protein
MEARSQIHFLVKEIPLTFECEIDLIAVWGKEISVPLSGINSRLLDCPGRKLVTKFLSHLFSTLFVYNLFCIILTSKSSSSSVNVRLS